MIYFSHRNVKFSWCFQSHNETVLSLASAATNTPLPPHLPSPPPCAHPHPNNAPTTPPPPPGSPPKTPTICCFGVWLDDFFCQLWSSTLTMMFWLFPPNSVNFLQTPLSNIWCSYFYQHQAMTICYIETLVLKSYMSTINSRRTAILLIDSPYMPLVGNLGKT